MTTLERTIDQKRAEHAIKQIRAIENQDYGHYVSYVSALPATIVMNGLGQALLSLLAKAGRKKESNKDPNYFLYSHVASWLVEQINELAGPKDKVIEQLMQRDQHVYLRAQAEAMAYLNWLKQFARAYLQEREDQADD
jgi:CRISPR-associated protein Cmr5